MASDVGVGGVAAVDGVADDDPVGPRRRVPLHQDAGRARGLQFGRGDTRGRRGAGAGHGRGAGGRPLAVVGRDRVAVLHAGQQGEVVVPAGTTPWMEPHSHHHTVLPSSKVISLKYY